MTTDAERDYAFGLEECGLMDEARRIFKGVLDSKVVVRSLCIARMGKVDDFQETKLTIIVGTRLDD